MTLEERLTAIEERLASLEADMLRFRPIGPKGPKPGIGLPKPSPAQEKALRELLAGMAQELLTEQEATPPEAP